MITRKSAPELELMRAANGLVASVLAALRRLVAPGVSTLELDDVAERQVLEAGAVPAFKGYHGYPATLCASVNDAVVHGIPSATPLVEGDIVSIDMGVVLDGFYGDSAITVPVGQVPDRTTDLLRVTRESLDLAIEQMLSLTHIRRCRRLHTRSSWWFAHPCTKTHSDLSNSPAHYLSPITTQHTQPII